MAVRTIHVLLIIKTVSLQCRHIYIILIAPSVTELEKKMLHMCENELRYTDMSINYNKRSK